jgi:hypothetical protein
VDFLGLSVEGFNLGWVVNLQSPAGRAVVQLVTRDATSPIDSVISVHVGDEVDAAYEEAQRRGFEIVHRLTAEPWVVRRFFVRAPDGNVVNIVTTRTKTTESCPRPQRSLILARGTPNGRGEGGAVWPSIIVKGASHLWRRSGAAGGGGFMPLNGVVSDHKQQGDLLLAPIWFICDHNRLRDPVSALIWFVFGHNRRNGNRLSDAPIITRPWKVMNLCSLRGY